MNKDANLNKVEIKKQELKTVELAAVEVESDAIIVVIDGWRMRVYFDKALSKSDKESIVAGKVVNVEYEGDIKNVHSLKLLPLKKI